MDELRLVKAVDGLGERIVVAVADAADGWLYPGFCQAFRNVSTTLRQLFV
jgi:hypothetical protein